MRPAQRLRPPLTTGLYYTQPGMAVSAASPTLNRLRLAPFDNHRAARFDRIASEVTTAAATATLRWVVYADDGRSYPGALLLDTGAVGDASTVGWKEATVDLLLGARRYWLGCIVQGVDASLRTHTGSPGQGVGVPSGSLATASGVAVGYFASGITAAAPAAFPPAMASTSLTPQVWLRKA